MSTSVISRHFFCGCLLGFMRSVAGSLLMSDDQRQQKAALVESHPLYGRKIHRGELPALLLLVNAVQMLRVGLRWRVAYLIQGEENITELEAAMWGSDSDVFVLTFRSQRPDTIFFPESLLAEGRNVLLAAAVLEELRRGSRYSYYMFLDADVAVDPPWTRSLLRLNVFLRDWEPAVGVPSYGDSNTPIDAAAEPRSIFNFDHIFVAVHADAVRVLLPYDTTVDVDCAQVSQWTFSSLASALFMGHVLQLPSVRAINRHHSAYPRQRCIRAFARATASLRGSAPAAARSCFPDPVWERGVAWGRPRPKGRAGSTADYRNATLKKLRPCDADADVRSMEASSEAMALSMSSVASRPFDAGRWNTLGSWILLTDDWALAHACFAIAQRLLEIAAQPPDPSVEQNLEGLRRLRQALPERALPSDMDSLWDGGKALEKVVRRALHIDEATPSIDVGLRRFVEHLLAQPLRRQILHALHSGGL